MKKEPKFHKKDFILLIILGVTILLVDYSLSWYKVYKEHNLNTAIISKYVNEVSQLEYENYIKESPTAFVYFGIIDEQESRNFENKFKKLITKYHLKDKIVYLNVKDIDFLTLYNKYSNEPSSTIGVPSIVYYENGKSIKYLNYSDKKYDEKEIAKFLKKYGAIEINE